LENSSRRFIAWYHSWEQAYVYNGMGDRVRMVRPARTLHFVYDTRSRAKAEYGAPRVEVKAEFIWALPPGAAHFEATSAKRAY
jgi:hypothetical protein